MGLYDTLIFEKDNPQIVCANNHFLHSFQTKDLDCILDNYFVRDNELYCSCQYVEIDEEDASSISLKDTPVEFVDISIIANIYTSCEKCPAIYTKSIMRGNTPWISVHRPWNEFNIHFEKGILTSIEVLEQETVEDVRKQRLEASKKSSHYKILEADDPELIQYLKGRNES